MSKAQKFSSTIERRGAEPHKVCLRETYNSLFDAIPATTPELLEQVYRIRYQVYCVENGFEDPRASPGGLERDACDPHSLHGLLIHRPTGIFAGTIRLVLPRLNGRTGDLPFFTVCGDRRVLRGEVVPPGSTAEFSRLAVSKAFRRRAGDDLYGAIHDAPDPRRIIPHLTLGLMAVALQMAQGHGIDHVCAVMEPSLLRLLGKLGIVFEPVGPTIEYHGLRQPCFARIDQLFATMERQRPDVWEVVTDRGRYWPSQYNASVSCTSCS